MHFIALAQKKLCPVGVLVRIGALSEKSIYR
jgi:hypothetical protein